MYKWKILLKSAHSEPKNTNCIKTIKARAAYDSFPELHTKFFLEFTKIRKSRTVDCGLWTGLWTVDCGLWAVDWTVDWTRGKGGNIYSNQEVGISNVFLM